MRPGSSTAHNAHPVPPAACCQTYPHQSDPPVECLLKRARLVALRATCGKHRCEANNKRSHHLLSRPQSQRSTTARRHVYKTRISQLPLHASTVPVLRSWMRNRRCTNAQYLPQHTRPLKRGYYYRRSLFIREPISLYNTYFRSLRKHHIYHHSHTVAFLPHLSG